MNVRQNQAPTDNVMFFEDHPLESDNKLFLSLLREALSGTRTRVLHEKTISRLERKLTRTFCRVVILDIMSEVPSDFRPIKGNAQGRVEPAMAGIEILRRIRADTYGNYEGSSVFIRSSRGEPHIRAECAEAGAAGYFQPGRQDFGLIERVKEVLAAGEPR